MRELYCFLIVCSLGIVHCVNKYSAAANIGKNGEDVLSLRTLDKPYRMAKLNLLWRKAQLRLSEAKLKSLFGELKIHDKEEITWKRLKSEGKDKDGLKEAQLRKKLIGIMSTYDLLEHFEDIQDPSKYEHHKALNEASEKHINKSLFKDKKLNKLWDKAEHAGFTVQELQALREEFSHHQDKVDQYYSILEDVKKGPNDHEENTIDEKLDRFNTIQVQEVPDKSYLEKAEQLREKHRDLRDGYDRLYRLAAEGPNSKEFVEPKVQGLWKVALETKFTPDELDSLRIELLHYENRLQKLRHLQAEAAFNEINFDANQLKEPGAKNYADVEDGIKKQARKLEKLHLHLETKIMQKHIEL